MKKIKKKKAWIGTLIEGIKDTMGTISGVINAKRQIDADEAEHKRQQGEIFKNENFQLANVLTQEANSQGYVDQMKKRIDLQRLGGSRRIKRKKCAMGGNIYGGTQAFGQTGNEYAGIASTGIAGSTVAAIMGAINPIKTRTLKYNEVIQAQVPKVIKDPNQPLKQQPIPAQQQYVQPYGQNINPILSQARLGCKRIKKRNTNRFK